MIRNCAAVFLLSLLLVAITATSPLYGADKPVKRFADRATFPARFAPRYAFDGIGSAAFAAPKETGQVSLGEV